MNCKNYDDRLLSCTRCPTRYHDWEREEFECFELGEMLMEVALFPKKEVYSGVGMPEMPLDTIEDIINFRKKCPPKEPIGKIIRVTEV